MKHRHFWRCANALSFFFLISYFLLFLLLLFSSSPFVFFVYLFFIGSYLMADKTTGVTKESERASLGLGILTDPVVLKAHREARTSSSQSPDSKTNQFFSNDLLTPRPPPSLPRPSVGSPSVSSPGVGSPSVGSPGVGSQKPPTASRSSRLLKLLSVNTSAAPTPIPNYLHSINKKRASMDSPDMTGGGSYSEEEFMCLPSPSPGSAVSITTEPYYVLPRATKSIPVISSSFPPHKTNRVPSLIEEPRLGDLEEDGLIETHSAQPSQRTPSSSLHHSDEDLTNKTMDKYHFQHLLGTGAFSKVYLANSPGSPHQHAIKVINKDRLFTNARIRSSIEREVKGGDLFDFVQHMHQESSSINETVVKRLFLQLVGVVHWLHAHNIVHRDLKLENVLIRVDKNNELILKVTDFGLARVVNPASPTLQTRCGSEEYAAPEILHGAGYDGRLTDTWALGVVLYGMLVGYLPFRYQPSRGEKISQLFYRIAKAQIKWPTGWSSEKCGVSMEARQVVEKILVRKPENRILLQNIDSLPWFTGVDAL
ncbi:kinase-like domain-containing protein [Spinellus fusiger]|nr:kinase-like domain-containing protein [Spinellus fusiger]